MYIPANHGAESTEVYFIALKGDFLGVLKREPVITSYEAKPQLADHKTGADAPLSKFIQ